MCFEWAEVARGEDAVNAAEDGGERHGLLLVLWILGLDRGTL